MRGSYKPKRQRNLYKPGNSKPFRLSRTKLASFLDCRRCFYLDRRLGVQPPPQGPYNLNNAVDRLLKVEFDVYRRKDAAHPFMKKHLPGAKPFQHPNLEKWREALHGGIQFTDPDTNFKVTGAVDDLWIKDGELIVVDYKATSTQYTQYLKVVRASYRKQLEVYQWLLRKNGFIVSDSAYLVNCNGGHTQELFEGSLLFDMQLTEHIGKTDWIEKNLLSAKRCLESDSLPNASSQCELCAFRSEAQSTEQLHQNRNKEQDILRRASLSQNLS